MILQIHDATEKPKPGTQCLVFYKQHLFTSDTCFYLDETYPTLASIGGKEGFYIKDQPYTDGPVDPRIIDSWVDLDEMEQQVSDAIDALHIEKRKDDTNDNGHTA